MKAKKIVGSIIFAIVLIALWQLLFVASTEWFKVAKSFAVPHPKGVWDSFINLCTTGTLLQAVGNSMLRGIIGFAIAIVVGIILGVMIVQSEYLARNLKPLIMGIQTLPSVCWVPFAIMGFGLKTSSIIFVVVMGSAFSIATAVESGVKSVPPIYIKAAKTMGVSKHKMYSKVIFPAALPSFMAGLKQSWSLAWRALMSAEVMSSAASVGLGFSLMMARDIRGDINEIMAVMVIIIIIGIIIDKGIFSTVENHILRKRGLLDGK